MKIGSFLAEIFNKYTRGRLFRTQCILCRPTNLNFLVHLWYPLYLSFCYLIVIIVWHGMCLWVKVKGKWSIAVCKGLTAMGTHLPYGITQCYLPRGRGDTSAFTPGEAGTRFSDPGVMQGWVALRYVIVEQPGYRTCDASVACPTLRLLHQHGSGKDEMRWVGNFCLWLVLGRPFSALILLVGW